MWWFPPAAHFEEGALASIPGCSVLFPGHGWVAMFVPQETEAATLEPPGDS